MSHSPWGNSQPPNNEDRVPHGSHGHLEKDKVIETSNLNTDVCRAILLVNIRKVSEKTCMSLTGEKPQLTRGPWAAPGFRLAANVEKSLGAESTADSRRKPSASSTLKVTFCLDSGEEPALDAKRDEDGCAWPNVPRLD